MSGKNRLIRDDIEELDHALSAAAPTRQASSVHTPGERGTYPGMRKVTCYVEPEVFRWLHAIRVETNRTMVELGREALTEFVKRHAAQRRFGGGSDT